MPELLVEIGTEEIPARFLAPAISYIEANLPKLLDELRLESSKPEVCATPRRIAFAIEVSEGQSDLETVKTGPSKDKAFDASGKPTAAAIGFAKSQGVSVDELTIISKKRGEFVAARKVEKGLPAKSVLEGELPNFILSIPFPKTMRWGTEKTRFARPIHWICALLGGKKLNFSLGNIRSSDTSHGHRFLSPGEFTVTSFEQLKNELKNRFVVLQQNMRKEMILSAAQKAAEQRTAELVLSDELLEELTYLVEYPSLYEGSFDKAYLKLPEEVLTTVMHHHQKYIPLRSAEKGLLNRFLFLSGTPVKDPTRVVEGNERVLEARLADAQFFFDEDRKKRLAELARDLSEVTFMEKLGSYAEKAKRLEQSARRIASIIKPAEADDVAAAALVCKADLLTHMVGEFPELQGTMGRIYATLEGYDEKTAWAIEDHYKPRGAEDELPKTGMGAILSLAEKFDNLASCFALRLIPSGTKDPYALRRQALGIIRILLDRGWDIKISGCVDAAIDALKKHHKKMDIPKGLRSEILEFIRSRMLHYFMNMGYAQDVVEAALNADFDVVHDAQKRIDAIASFRARDDFDDLAISFKRVVNIIPDDFKADDVALELLGDGAEKELWNKFDEVAKKAEPKKRERKYAEALELILELKPHIDKFFDDVLVMCEDQALQTNRLSLLATIAHLYATIADFKKLGGIAEKR